MNNLDELKKAIEEFKTCLEQYSLSKELKLTKSDSIDSTGSDVNTLSANQEIIKFDNNGQWRIEKAQQTKHDRCVEEVKEKSPEVDNPHAVCVSAGVEPEKWKK